METFIIKKREIQVIKRNENEYHFPTLYRLSKTNKVWEWKCWVIDNVVYRQSGYSDGKQNITTRECESKQNTTPFEQALFEAQAFWNKNVTKSDYTPNLPSNTKSVEHKSVQKVISSNLTDETDPTTQNLSTVFPMNAQDYRNRGHVIDSILEKGNYIYTQRKLDGNRCLARIVDEQVHFHSRGGKLFLHLNHIRDEIRMLLRHHSHLILDGELYTNALPSHIISGICRSKNNPHPQESKLQFWIFDIIDPSNIDLPFEQRLTILNELFSGFHRSSILQKVESEKINQKDEIIPKHNQYVSEGYEGIILRDPNGVYQCGKRSAQLQKYKSFLDDEYKIVGYRESKGSEKGAVIWICQTTTQQQFDVRPKGTIEYRRELYKNADKFIGKLLTVRCQEITEYGIPRNPVGVGIRGKWDM